jgi:hypothetical protein
MAGKVALPKKSLKSYPKDLKKGPTIKPGKEPIQKTATKPMDMQKQYKEKTIGHPGG